MKINTNNSLKRDVWIINLLKSVFILSVIFIHCNTYFNLDLQQNILFAFFIQLAVPFFMVLSGYTFSIGLSKRQLSFKKMYEYSRIFKQLIRFIVPAFVTGIVYSVIMIFVGEKADLLKDLLKVQFGPGSYYFMLMIEFVIVFPLIYAATEKWGGIALLQV